MALERSLEEREVIEMLDQGRAQDAKVYAWYILGNHVLWAEVRIQNLVRNKRELVFTVSESSAVFLEEIISGRGKINLYLESAKLVFRCALKEFTEEGKLVLTYPDHYFVEDRRESSRTYLENSVKLKIQTKDKTLHRDCYDLGDGGLSFVISNQETTPFSLEDKLKVQMTLGEDSFVLNCEVVSKITIHPFKFENTPYGGKKISIRYIDLDEKIKGKILKYIEGFKSISNE